MFEGEHLCVRYSGGGGLSGAEGREGVVSCVDEQSGYVDLLEGIGVDRRVGHEPVEQDAAGALADREDAVDPMQEHVALLGGRLGVLREAADEAHELRAGEHSGQPHDGVTPVDERGDGRRCHGGRSWKVAGHDDEVADSVREAQGELDG